MPEPLFISKRHNPASLNKTPPLAPLEKSGEGLFIPTGAKFAFVTALLWSGLLTLCALSWIGAVHVGAAIARWLGA